jgi:hypothetical protein
MATTEEMMRLIEAKQYEQMRQALLKRNMAYADPQWQSKLAKLTPEQESAFTKWLASNKVPFNPTDKFPDYDMRGYYLAQQKGQAGSAVNPVDKQLHYPDTYKTPYHESFSRESQYATEGAPSWKGEQLISPSGEIVYETKPKQKSN